ncbi:ABC transporter ATP-binding protein [Azohydromonas caseinilytica]|uniref:ABC transporter ATP-binding protein n=1 Tax=Azohydromonas caseinilytica TaxID=2728836 RepID=A0A848FCR9_9BURK|nr:ABC transporter ATP-binding protein [Azohydromonas caseinilytica]NML18017.1 ABC transporter ATP-binding protein [Azohydromonas caseinilytica]
MSLHVEELSVELPAGRGLRRVVRELSFHIAPGEVLGVVGESGCGKSVTGLALMGLLPPGAVVSARRLELCGRALPPVGSPAWAAVRGRQAAMVFQNPMSALNPCLTLETQLVETLRLRHAGEGRRALRERAQALLGEVGIGAAGLRLRCHPHELSGGMAQRVMIALALACAPALLIADEPTTALDATLQVQILDLIARLARTHRMAVLLVSHDIGVVRAYADRVQVMYSGQIVESGPVDAVAHTPAHPYTRGLLHALPGRGGAPGAPLPALPGTVLPVGQEAAGCRFESRCAQAQPVCRQPVALRPHPRHPGVSLRCAL